MKLRLDSFQALFVLRASERITKMDAQILCAGIHKLIALERPWLLIDLETSSMEPAALDIIVQERERLQSTNKKVQVKWVGSAENPFDFDDLISALDELQDRKLHPYRDKLDFTAQIIQLKKLLHARECAQTLLSTNDANPEVAPDPKIQLEKISKLEAHFQVVNRNLRSAHSMLINQVISPSAEALDNEPLALVDTQTYPELSFLTGIENQIQKMAESIPPNIYDPKDLEESNALLQKELDELYAASKVPFIPNSDRMVSLIIENETLLSQISEIEKLWIDRLMTDADLKGSDLELGMIPMIQVRREREQKLSEKKKQKAS